MKSSREVHFFYGVRNREEHAMKEPLEKIAAENPNVRSHVCYSKPEATDVVGKDYQHAKRVSVDLFKKVLPSSNYDYYICGPGPLMESITSGLADWGVPKENVHYETFGPSSVKKVATVVSPGSTEPTGFSIECKKSGKTLKWCGDHHSILDFVEAEGIAAASGCRAGSCGTCQVAVLSGEVGYVQNSDFHTEPGTRLTCIGAPKSDLVLDL